MRRFFAAAFVACCILGLACKTPSPPPPPSPAAPALSSVFFPAKLAEMDTAIASAISSNKTPGAVLWLERHQAAYHKAYGRRALLPNPEPMTEDTIFDAASLTKVMATAPSILLLIEENRLQLDAPIQQYIPQFAGDQKNLVTVRHLLTHTSGLRPGLSPTPVWSGCEKAIQLACAEKLLNPPGTVFRYSDINFILLGEIVQRVSGQRLDQFAQKRIFEPLKMSHTRFLPPQIQRPLIAPTEKIGDTILRGEVHDPTARRMGGVAGHAGLFTTAHDLARFARMFLNEGSLNGVRIFRAETVRLMTSVQSPEVVPARRGLGWDIDSPYSRPRGKHFPLGSFGHTGFTGTCLWIDPFSKSFWFLLSNRVHPDGTGNILDLQATLANLSAEAVANFNFANVIGSLPPRAAPPSPAPTPRPTQPRSQSAPVLNGIDVLAAEKFASLKGLRIGLITNHTGTDRHRNPTIDLLHSAPDVHLKALFSPEHGIRGLLDEKVPDGSDPKTSLPIFSLYGESRIPSPAQLRDLDALVFDIQDIGCRFYTYVSTMGNCLQAAAQANLKFFVLDRVNPINGSTIDGPVLAAETSFTAFHPIPIRHGMTAGELARMFNSERSLKAALTVVPLRNWTRSMWFDETALPWINPSPNMRSLTQATLYPGVGLLETTALSVGRGTDTPFEIIGAPYVHDSQLAQQLNHANLPGVRFVPVHFTPNASVFKNQLCKGVNIILTDREQCNVVDIGLTAALILHRLHPNDFGLDKFNRLLAHPPTLDAIKAGKSLADIRQTWATDLAEFKKRRSAFLLYE